MEENLIKKRILVVEDEKLLLKAITGKLEKAGFEVNACSTGMEAVEILKNIKNNQEFPKVIWLDYYMNGYNGLAFMNDIKKIENLPEIPIIVVSNLSDPEKVSRMLALGVQKYYLKADNSLEELIESIKDLIKQEEQNNGK